MKPWLHLLASPLGPLRAALNPGGAIAYLGFAEHEPRASLLASLGATAEDFTRDPARLEPLRRQLEEYFAGKRRTFDLPLNLRGTPFRRRVWAELLRIPYGQTLSYGELARRLGDPNLCRAVGAANGANPVSILVPCHRVLGAQGGLTGYAGGLPLKAALLRLEGVQGLPWQSRQAFSLGSGLRR